MEEAEETAPVTFEYVLTRGSRPLYLAVGYVFGKEEKNPRGIIVQADSKKAFEQRAVAVVEEFFPVSSPFVARKSNSYSSHPILRSSMLK